MITTLFLISSALIAIVSCGRLEPQYLPPRPSGGGGSGSGSGSGFGGSGASSSSSSSGGSFGGNSGHGNGGLGGGFGSGAGHSAGNGGLGGGFGSSSSSGSFSSGNSGSSGSGNEIPITKFENVNNGDGNYHFSYETGNGISAHETGSLGAQGPEGPAVTAEGGFSFRTPDGQQIQLTYTADETGFHPVGPHLPTPPPIPEEILRSIEFNKQNPSSGEGSYNGGGGGTGGKGSGNGGAAGSGYHY